MTFWRDPGTGVYYLTIKANNNGAEATVYSASIPFQEHIQFRIEIIEDTPGNYLIFFYLNGQNMFPTGHDCTWLINNTAGNGIVELTAQTTGITNTWVYFDNYIERLASEADTDVSVTFEATINGILIPTGTFEYPVDSELSIFAIPDTGYEFNQWIVDGTPTVGGNPLIYPLLAPATIGATFQAANLPPTAFFTVSKSAVQVNESVTFDASGSSDPDGTIIGYDWNFGDGEVGSGVSVTHAWPSEGSKTVTLTVTDDDGASDSAEITIQVSTIPPPPEDGDQIITPTLVGPFGFWQFPILTFIQDWISKKMSR